MFDLSSGNVVSEKNDLLLLKKKERIKGPLLKKEKMV